ncbi:hypothetical protein BCR41DRAFT_107569 [Lobosporangium transversale]|uniref:Secreted protein n=1 Tax=Lobosporangium transversale TaxID=64571 RepID=A0A1Y2GJR6_9FUNG|nr:hypothetical protein BCR41DRAFT_107569 [Lobosporangium transversale]ORZ11685.1 hypothetical protein BCR41DRAFT_107569 [Lobosporangium transversale]|eukprot:XP_021879782.1 hypothetical protein BCR41DRAFT_107569 [Lobosporangium transversale]
MSRRFVCFIHLLSIPSICFKELLISKHSCSSSISSSSSLVKMKGGSASSEKVTSSFSCSMMPSSELMPSAPLSFLLSVSDSPPPQSVVFWVFSSFLLHPNLGVFCGPFFCHEGKNTYHLFFLWINHETKTIDPMEER